MSVEAIAADFKSEAPPRGVGFSLRSPAVRAAVGSRPGLPGTPPRPANAPPFGHTRASVLLDLLRGLAAALVLLDHWRNMLFVDYPMLPPSYRAFAAPFYLLSSAGHQAVVVFFVLSGFLVGGSVFRALDRDTWSWKSYLTHRLVRLWIVLLPGLLLCVAWDLLGLHLHRAPQLYGGANFNHLVPPVLPRLSVHGFFGNLFFLGGLRVPTLGSDGALWSLAFEFWYYLLFPLALLLTRRSQAWGSRMLLASILAACCFVAGANVLLSFPIWLLGAWLARLRTLQPGRTLRRLVPCGYPLFFFGCIKVRLLPGPWQDYALGLATTALLLVLLTETQPADPARRPVRFARSLASFSFTLYVAHLPFMLLLTSCFAGDARWQPRPQSLALGTLILALVLIYSYGLFALTESRTEAVRRTVETWLAAGWFTPRLPTGAWTGGVRASVHDTVQ